MQKRGQACCLEQTYSLSHFTTIKCTMICKGYYCVINWISTLNSEVPKTFVFRTFLRLYIFLCISLICSTKTITKIKVLKSTYKLK